jgi:hypothetical protein
VSQRDGSARNGVDARDGLTRLERIILWQLRELQNERGGATVPTAMLYGRVLEHIDVSEAELVATLQRLIGVYGKR